MILLGNLSRQADKWMWHLAIDKDWLRGGPMGWRTVELGILKITNMPPEGQGLEPGRYKGFLIGWHYWLPIEWGKR